MSSEQFSILRYQKNSQEEMVDWVAKEEPLELRIEGRSVAVLMRTPDKEEDIELVLGFLTTEGVIEDFSDIHAIAHIVEPNAPKYNTINVVLSTGVPAKRRHRGDRELFASSSCGICGKATQERIFQYFPPIIETIDVSPQIICSLPEKIRNQQKLFQQTGGLHAAALFDENGALLILREDIGRHNAVDKIIGWTLQEDIDCSKLILLVSGRVAFEIVQKALAVKIPIVAAIGAPSSMAVEFCSQANIRLFGFVNSERYNEYF